MASTLTRVLVHVTFSTKGRALMIRPEVEAELYAYMGGICRGHGSALLACGGAGDHVHLLVSLGKTVALSELMLNVTRDSSRWMNETGACGGGFAWQEGYFAFSIGESGVEGLVAYIAGQKKHHATTDYKDEMRKFFEKYRMEWDEQYVWG